MSGFLKGVLAVLLVLSVFTFIFFLNVKLFFSSPEGIKERLNKSNIYPAIVVGLQDSIVKYNDLGESQGELSEVLSEVIDERSVQVFIESIVDQTYDIISGKNESKKLTIKFSDLQQKAIEQLKKKNIDTTELTNLPMNQEIDLGYISSPLQAFAKTNTVLLVSGILIILISLALLSFGGDRSQRIKFLASNYLTIAILTLFETLVLYTAFSSAAIKGLTDSADLSDVRFISSLRKLIDMTLQYERSYYTVVTAVLVVITIALFVIARALKEQKFEIKQPIKQPIKTQ